MVISYHEKNKQYFTTVIANVELVHECSSQHLLMETAILKKMKPDQKNNVEIKQSEVNYI